MWGTDNGQPRLQPLDQSPRPDDEGGLRAPPDLHGWRKAWWWFHFLILVKLARLRFVAVLLVIGIVITQWDLLMAYYDRWTRSAGAAEVASGDHEYFCPMHPLVVRDNPKEKCPICFMPLSKRKKGDVKEEVLPAGVVNRVQLSPYRVALAGIGTWTLDYIPLSKEITAVGYIEFNERGERNVPARVAGRLDKLFVNETGQMVREGDPLASLYSPELIVSVQNLLDARKGNNRSLEQSARRRLELLGIGDRQIDEILERGTAETHLVIGSPISGHVVNKYVREGQYVEEGTSLYDVVDLSTVWIEAQIYEDDLSFLPIDLGHPERQQTAESIDVMATTRALPNEVFRGKLTFVYPHVDERTRTVTARFELANPDHKLRPGSTATVTLRVPASKVAGLARAEGDGDSKMMPASRIQPVGLARTQIDATAGGERLESDKFLAVPQSAVIDTGKQQIVYRETVPGVYEGVKVTLGPKMAGPEDVTFYPVLHGLSQGERVVTAGSFLVDAETRLNPAAGSIYFGGSSGSKGGTSSVTTVRPSTPEDEEAKITAALARLSEPDRRLALAQEYCPILSDNWLGSMGEPVKVMVDGEPVFLCCEGCKKQALNKQEATLAKVNALKRRASTRDVAMSDDTPPSLTARATTSQEEAEIQAELAKLSAPDRLLAAAQRFCPISEGSRLGSMGKPVKLTIDGQAVFVCCEGCEEDARKESKQTLSRVRRLVRENNDAGR
jgi:Cu(I)/Ag(I) efflux system membrane fusion protein